MVRLRISYCITQIQFVNALMQELNPFFGKSNLLYVSNFLYYKKGSQFDSKLFIKIITVLTSHGVQWNNCRLPIRQRTYSQFIYI